MDRGTLFPLLDGRRSQGKGRKGKMKKEGVRDRSWGSMHVDVEHLWRRE